MHYLEPVKAGLFRRLRQEAARDGRPASGILCQPASKAVLMAPGQLVLRA